MQIALRLKDEPLSSTFWQTVGKRYHAGTLQYVTVVVGDYELRLEPQEVDRLAKHLTRIAGDMLL